MQCQGLECIDILFSFYSARCLTIPCVILVKILMNP
jgi:hypothetical protein